MDILFYFMQEKYLTAYDDNCEWYDINIVLKITKTDSIHNYNNYRVSCVMSLNITKRPSLLQLA